MATKPSTLEMLKIPKGETSTTILDLPYGVLVHIFSLLLRCRTPYISARTLRECTDVFSLALSCKSFHTFFCTHFFNNSNLRTIDLLYPHSSLFSIPEVTVEHRLSSSPSTHDSNILHLPFICGPCLRVVRLQPFVKSQTLCTFLKMLSIHSVNLHELAFNDDGKLDQHAIHSLSTLSEVRTIEIGNISKPFVRLLKTLVFPKLTTLKVSVSKTNMLQVLSTCLYQRYQQHPSSLAPLQFIHVYIAAAPSSSSTSTFAKSVEQHKQWKDLTNFITNIVDSKNIARNLKSFYIDGDSRLKRPMDVAKRQIQQLFDTKKISSPFLTCVNDDSLTFVPIQSHKCKNNLTFEQVQQSSRSMRLNEIVRSIIQRRDFQLIQNEIMRLPIAPETVTAQNLWYDSPFEHLDDEKLQMYKQILSDMKSVHTARFDMEQFPNSPYPTRASATDFLKFASLTISILPNIQRVDIGIGYLLEVGEEELIQFFNACRNVGALVLISQEEKKRKSTDKNPETKQIDTLLYCLPRILNFVGHYCGNMRKIVVEGMTYSTDAKDMKRLENIGKLVLNAVVELENKSGLIDLELIREQISRYANVR